MSSAFGYFFFTPLRWLHLSEKAISPLCQVGGIVNLSIFSSSSKGLIFNVFFFKGGFSLLWQGWSYDLCGGFRFALGLDVGVLKLH